MRGEFEIPDPVLTRLDLPRSEDREALLRLFIDPAVRAHLGGPLTVEAAALRVEGIIADSSGQVRVIRPETGEAVGLVWLAPHHDEPDPELSLVLLPEWQGRGHAFRAASQVLCHAFREHRLARVVAETQSANFRCVALLLRLGMVLERKFQRFGAEQSLHAIRREQFS